MNNGVPWGMYSMTREETIRILDPVTTAEALAEIEYYNGFTCKTAAVQAVSDACVLAVAALREQEERRWIPVTEKMPDEHESLFAHYKGTNKWCDGMFMTISDLVIVFAEYENGERIVKTANATEGIWKVKDSFYPCRVTHWMPLPEPPEKAINKDHNKGKENDYGNQSE